jgi:hypothetical protein
MEDEYQRDTAPLKSQPDSRPEWWEENRELRQTLDIGDIGPYEPPRFADEVYTYEVVTDLESKYDCSIHILSLNPNQDTDWEIRVDGQKVTSTERYRDEHGNGTYAIDSETFIKAVEDAVAE